MSPLKIEICLHYFARCNDHPWLFSGAPIVNETFGDLVTAGLLERCGPGQETVYTRTDRLESYVAALKATSPNPEKTIESLEKRVAELRKYEQLSRNYAFIISRAHDSINASGLLPRVSPAARISLVDRITELLSQFKTRPCPNRELTEVELLQQQVRELQAAVFK